LQFKIFSGVSSCGILGKPGELKILHIKVTFLFKRVLSAKGIAYAASSSRPFIEDAIHIGP